MIDIEKVKRMPFLDRFREKLLKDEKWVTTRSKRYGKPGDLFKAFGAVFRFLEVYQANLTSVATVLYEPEGFQSTEEFIECWEDLHPIVGYLPWRLYWVHEFERVLQTPEIKSDRCQKRVHSMLRV